MKSLSDPRQPDNCVPRQFYPDDLYYRVHTNCNHRVAVGQKLEGSPSNQIRVIWFLIAQRSWMNGFNQPAGASLEAGTPDPLSNYKGNPWIVSCTENCRK